jgi:hypothetical protein
VSVRVRWLVVLCVFAAAPAASLPFERTETREPCASYDPQRRPFFGDTHVHTGLSFDAMGQGVRARPRDAYRYARGERIGLPPFDRQGNPSSYVRLRRSLDFAVVTDHSELLGEALICQTPGMPGYGSLICTVVRRWPRLGYALVNGHVYSNPEPKRYTFCGEEGRECLAMASGPWRETREAAEEFYDRTASCSFTSFVGYEWTGMPSGNNIHRNVIFRNSVVQERPTTYIETPTAEGLWRALLDECLERDNGCEAIAIPHNSNVSNGLMFQIERQDGTPITAADARTRARIETLVEITQHKGDSECGLGSADELCAYEKVPWIRMMDQPRRSLWATPPPLSYARDVITEGLVQYGRLGANPFKLGFIGSTDTHLGTPGMVDEDQHVGHAAGLVLVRHGIPPLPDAPRFNPGGLAVLWAEENSRDALFAAMKRREAYGTSGPHIVVRFFGGWDFSKSMCSDGDLVARGYASGTPMGGDLPAAGAAAPTFAVWALRDPAIGGAPSTPLQRIQIVKSWVAGGRGRERVYNVAGDTGSGVGVDLTTCRPRGAGFDELCSVWTDPDFDATQPAAYYARVVENPSCRWSAYACLRNRVDCDDPSTFKGSLAACCDAEIPKTIQERAWTSPIWYSPAGGP